jgi:hypothetical protein
MHIELYINLIVYTMESFASSRLRQKSLLSRNKIKSFIIFDIYLISSNLIFLFVLKIPNFLSELRYFIALSISPKKDGLFLVRVL